jgi:predicted nucleic acid-binding protein
MQTNILVDPNIIIDVFLERKGFESSSAVLQLAEQKSYTLYVSAHIVSTLAYLLESAKVPRQQIRKHIDWILHVFSVVPVDGSLLSESLKSNVTEFEDAMIEQAALVSHCRIIITRNTKDFTQSTIPATTPEIFMTGLNK